MKTAIAFFLVALFLVGGLALNGLQRSKVLSQQVEDYERQNSQLLTQIENNSLQKLENAEAIQSLQSELNNRESQLAALSRQLEAAQQQIDPNYSEIENQMRQELIREVQASNDTLNADPRMAVLKQLLELDPMMMGEMIALNAEYGEFIRNLDVDEERMEVVVNALHNLITDQNQLRTEIIQELQANPQAATRGDLRRQMRAVSDPDSQLEALSYDLTESELDAFSDFQEQRRSSANSFSLIGGAAGGAINGPMLFSSEVIQDGSGQSRAIQLMPATPDN